MKLKAILGIVLTTLLLLSCGKEDDSGIPNVAVNFQISISDPRVAALQAGGGTVIINGIGVAGLILYREFGGGYAAYDRCSSYQPQNKCAVNLDNNSLTVTDPCSGSKFSLTDGTPVKAPATRALKSYYVSVSNYEIFVSN